MPTPPKKHAWLRKHRGRIASGFDRALLYEFDVLKEHHTFAVKSLLAKQKALEVEVEGMVDGMDAEERREYYDYMNDEYISAMESLPRIQWHAQFLIVYSTFEHMLNELCRIVQRRSGFSLSFKDLGGQGITRSRNYLVKVAGVVAPFESAAWHRALLLAEVRNALAHRNGEIDFQPKNPTSLSAKLLKEEGVKLKQIIEDQEDAQVILTSEFVSQAIADLRKVLVDVCNFELYANES